MPEVQISRHDIDSLADKLGRLEPDLSPPERALLLFMLSTATEAINHSQFGTVVYAPKDQNVPVVVAMSGPAPSIKEEFARAFTPRAAGEGLVVRGSIGGVAPPPPEE